MPFHQVIVLLLGLFGVVSAALADHPHYTSPPYIISRAAARKALLEFARTDCPVHPDADTHRPSRRTFRRAITGDFKALTTVFIACDYYEYQDHSDYDALSDKPWKLLHTVGDRRFAAYLLSLDPATRQVALRWILIVRDWYSWHVLADYDGYLRKHFPRVAAIALAPRPNTPNQSLQRTAGGASVAERLLSPPPSLSLGR